MKFNTPLWKLLCFLFENPYEEFYLRELARKANISIFSAKKLVDEMVKDGILVESRKGNMRYFKANLSNLFFKHLKISFSLKRIMESGLIEYLKENIPAISSITLYGSVAKGEDDKKSDIDLLVIGQKKKIDLSRFEKKIGREIRIIVMKWAEWRKLAGENKAFYREIIANGIALYGEKPVIE